MKFLLLQYIVFSIQFIMLSQKVHPETTLHLNTSVKWTILCSVIYIIVSSISDFSASLCENNCEMSFLKLQTWLFVHSMIPLIFFATIFVYKMCFECVFSNQDKMIVVVFTLCLVFSFIWQIVGSILFWKFLMQSDECLLWINYYMSVRLITGYLFYIILVFLYYFK
jgi:hypothetical protein